MGEHHIQSLRDVCKGLIGLLEQTDAFPIDTTRVSGESMLCWQMHHRPRLLPGPSGPVHSQMRHAVYTGLDRFRRIVYGVQEFTIYKELAEPAITRGLAINHKVTHDPASAEFGYTYGLSLYGQPDSPRWQVTCELEPEVDDLRDDLLASSLGRYFEARAIAAQIHHGIYKAIA